MAILNREAEEIIDWNKETGLLGEIDYDPRLEFASFTAIFNQIVDNLRSPADVKRDQKLEDIQSELEELAKKLDKLNDIDAVRAELARWIPPQETSSIAITEVSPIMVSQKVIRWLHLSDFHVGKDGYGQRQLFKYIINHVKERVASGNAPDLVFITGDIANKGLDKDYKEFYDQFFMPLLECLPIDSQGRIFIVPGNHDVDRNQARAVQTKDVLLRVPEFLDPTEQGQFERQSVFPRFKSYLENDITNTGDHWLNTAKGIFQTTVEIQGIKLGVVGLNTAWLSCSDDDRHNLSAGKSLLEDGLEAIKSCDIKIVLGHHPVDWFLDTELEPVRALLGRHTALYLHGHMHKPLGKYVEGAGYPFLALQSGASFQARENEVWVNRFLWCELDLTTCELSIEPLQWSKNNQNWVTDGDAFPPRYQQGNQWILPLPSPAPLQPVVKKTSLADKSQLGIPDGWSLIDAQYLKDRNKELSPDQAISFFDGRAPIWREALAPQIPRREIVAKLVSDLETARKEGGLRVTLLTGAAGEGKTTALLQIVSDLVSSSDDWHVLWRHDSSAPLPGEFIARLSDEQTWLFVSDDVEVIARKVFDSVENLKLTGRKNAQFLLCCRDTDWKAADVERLPWNQHATFVAETLRGLSKADAEKVVSAWALFGKDGLKTLDGLQFEIATSQLLIAAKSEETNSSEGSFFGAILQVRWGEGLKNHIDSLLKKLEKKSVSSGKTLLDAFAYICAMHAENLQILSKEVLAGVLEIQIQELKKKVLSPLGEEAAIATTGRMVFTRHRAIANSAIKILSDNFDIDPENLFIDLARTALRSRAQGIFVPNIGNWNYISDHFFENENPSLGIRIAQTILEIEPSNPYLIAKLAQLFRKAGQPDQSVQVFRSAPSNTKRDRAFYYEWGTAEGNAGDHALDAWLAAFSLSDQVTRQLPDNERAKLSLAGLSLAFAELYDHYNALVFAEACGAAAQLGLLLKLDNKTKSWLSNNQERAKIARVDVVQPKVALERFHAGVNLAWEQREDDLLDWITPGNSLTFNGLARLLRIT